MANRSQLHVGIAAALGAATLLLACSGSEDDAEPTCPVGAETCACTPGGSCDPGLDCRSGICVDREGAAAAANGGEGGGEEENGGDGGATATGGAAGTLGPIGGGTTETGGAPPGTGGATSATGGDGGCATYCDAPREKCGLAPADVDACVEDCEAVMATGCGMNWWFAVLNCGASEAAWTCSDGQATLTGCRDEQGYYHECVNSDVCAAACAAPREKCSQDSAIENACVIDCTQRLQGVDALAPMCQGLAMAGWLCLADPDVWTCSGTTATRVGCDAEADALATCLGGGTEPAASTCGSYAPCCEFCDTNCTLESGTHLESYQQCLDECIFCCESCDV